MRTLLLFATLFGATTLAGGVSHDSKGLATDQVATQSMSARSVEQTLKAHTDALMAISGVVGVGQGLLDRTLSIKVFVVEKTPELQQHIPTVLDGHPVVIEQTGPIKALPKGVSR